MLSVSNQTWFRSTGLCKYLKNVNKTCPAWAELIEVGGQTDGRTDGQTNMTEFILGFAILRKQPKRLLIISNKPKH